MGEISFFSFGRDKVISSVFGGMVVTKNKRLYEKIKNERDKLGYPPFFWVIQQLLHPVLMSVILPLYNIGISKFTIGKVLLFLLQKFHFLSKAIVSEEKNSYQPKKFIYKMPGALSVLAYQQFNKLDRFNRNRINIADRYFKNLKGNFIELTKKEKGAIWHRFPVLVDQRDKILNCAKLKGILLGDWYRSVVFPADDIFKLEYVNGSCPKAEEYSKKLINLPTYPTMTKDDSDEVISVVKECQNIK